MAMVSRVVRVLVAIGVLAAGLDAQSHRGVIRGRVEDASGAVVVSAGVTAVNEATSQTRASSTSEDGAFAIAELAPGTWRVEITAPGHRMHVETLTLEVNQERRADVRLQLGALTDRIEVIAPAADIRRDSPAVGTIVENRQILDMPLDGRNFRRDQQERFAETSRSVSTAAGKTSTRSPSTGSTTSIQSSTRQAFVRQWMPFGNSRS
jgi:Carboxypeptidase regulatory-like domain